MSILKTTGDLLTADCVIRCHQVNCRGVMGAGIAKQVQAKYPEAYAPYVALCKQFGGKLLGEVQLIPCHDGTIIANLFGQDGFGTNQVQTNIEALAECLSKVYLFSSKTGATVGFPRLMGADRGGGDWNAIETLIEQYFSGAEANCVIVQWAGVEPKAVAPVVITPEHAVGAAVTPPKMAKVTIYTDGSCIGNPGPGGWACVLQTEAGAKKELSGGEADTTNNRMELTAVIQALKSLKIPCSGELYTDSAYVVNSITKGWLRDWKAAGWKKKTKGEVLNIDLWQKLDEELQRHDLTFIWVKGHASNAGNNRCDELAVAEARKLC